MADTLAVIQARMGSSRLPGKVMREVARRPMIDYVVARARRIRGIDETVVATSTRNQEKPLVDHLEAQGVPVVRGDEKDVLSRYVQATDKYEAEVVVRLTGDNPLLMPDVSSRVVAAYQERSCDYASNTLDHTYPLGVSTEVVSSNILYEIDTEVTRPAYREHVTRYVRQRPDRFRLCSVRAEVDRSGLRWTVDEEADLRFVRRVYKELGERAMEATYEEVLALLEEQPEIAEINSDVEQKKV